MKKIKLVSLTVAVLMLMVCLCSCAGGVRTAEKPAMQDPDKQVEIKGECTIEQIGDSVRVIGRCADLMKGSVMRISVDAPTGEMLAKVVVYKEADDFMYDFEIGARWPEVVMGNVVCVPSSIGEQPEEVIEAYGEKFEYLTGENVVWNNEGNALVLQSETITLDKAE